MLELTIPQPGEKIRQTKDLVFSILSDKQPLTTMEIYNIIKKQYNVSLTYQAVKQAIDHLLEKKVLTKNKKQYRLNRTWLLEVKSTVDNLLNSYESGKDIDAFRAAYAREQYAIYTFTSLLELDNFWDDMIIHVAKHIQGDEDKSFLAHAQYGWWLLINFGRETKLFQTLEELGLERYNLFLQDVPLNRWAEHIYLDMGVLFKINERKDTDETITLNIIGDTIIQVKYPQKILDEIERIYTTYTSTQEINAQEITKLAHMPCEIKFIMFKNKELADSLRDKYKQEFKK